MIERVSRFRFDPPTAAPVIPEADRHVGTSVDRPEKRLDETKPLVRESELGDQQTGLALRFDRDDHVRDPKPRRVHDLRGYARKIGVTFEFEIDVGGG